MGRHVDLGVRFAAALGASEDLQRVVAHHHTRFDADLIIADSAQDAVHAARVVCVADALVTMMSAREYSPARSMTEALSELRRHRGGMFDPAAVAAAHIYASSHVPAPAPLARAA
jgi:HD-GYP domain-containing protein (c-di-GMP phosphodiesterase class II)